MVKIKKQIDSELLCNSIVEGMKDNKAKNIVVLDLRKIENAVTDFFVICSGDSTTQVEGIASSVTRLVRKELQEKPWHQEGKGNNQWILLDYVNVVTHIFFHEQRDYYELEELWADAVRTDIPDVV
ncbi:MAG: ribosome silencing factor [Crocinitomicaceae bacterium]|nr:ribosome silencing factor [Crocinitomicaceae bacterium]